MKNHRGGNPGLAADDVPAQLIASLFMTIYLTEIRRWLNQSKPRVKPGVATLRELLWLSIRGIQPPRQDGIPPDRERQA